jgi:hypothetical protein
MQQNPGIAGSTLGDRMVNSDNDPNLSAIGLNEGYFKVRIGPAPSGAGGFNRMLGIRSRNLQGAPAAGISGGGEVE